MRGKRQDGDWLWKKWICWCSPSRDRARRWWYLYSTWGRWTQLIWSDFLRPDCILFLLRFNTVSWLFLETGVGLFLSPFVTCVCYLEDVRYCSKREVRKRKIEGKGGSGKMTRASCFAWMFRFWPLNLEWNGMMWRETHWYMVSHQYVWPVCVISVWVG